MANRPAARAAARRSSMAWYRPMMPRYRNSRINSVVRRGSQSHHVPHIGLPQIEPVSRVIRVNAAPIGAQAIARISHSLIRQTSAIVAYSAISANTAMLIHAAGTRTEEHTSELQSLMRISYAVFCLKKKHQQ